MEQNNSNGQTMKPNSEYVKCAAGFGLGNKNDMAVLGYLITQTFTAVYRENKCIAIPLYKLSSCTGVARSTIWDSVIRLESRGCIEVERPKVRMKGSATTYRVCQWVMDKVAERKDGKAAKIVKRNENMDQDNELKRQNQSLQAENEGLRLQLGEKDKRISELQTRVDNAIKWWNATNGKMKALEAENAELKKAGPNTADQNLVRENEKLRSERDEAVRKEKAAANFSAIDRSKANKFQDEVRELKAEMAELEKKYKAAVKELDELKGADGMVTVEPEVPYGIMKPDELLHEISTVIKNRN